jgi:hypothetical protein
VNSETEGKYGITELECYAVVWAIKLFRPYLYGRCCEIITDHAALKWLMSSPNLTGKLHRWALTLQEFDFTVQYRPGATNVVADALSRAPVAAAVRAAKGRQRRARRQRAEEGSAAATALETREESGRSRVATTARPRARASTGTGRSSRDTRMVTKGGHSVQLSRSKALRRTLGETTEVPAMYDVVSETALSNEQEAVEVATSTMAAGVARRTTNDGARTTQSAETSTGRRKTVTWADSGATPRERAKPRPAAGTHTSRARGRGVSTDASRQHEAQRPRDEVRADEGREASDATVVPRREVVRVDEARQAADAEAARSRREADPTLQLTDAEIGDAQAKSKSVQKMLREGVYQGREVSKPFGLVMIDSPNGRKLVLPPALWATVFKECHDSVWAGHLRAAHTYGRIALTYWWPNLQREVKRWVLGCQECGSRKARPREVVPPLRSLRGGDVGDRWALDVAGPLPATDGGHRYVIAAVEYVTRYAVAIAVKDHTAGDIAAFLMKQVVLRFGPFRELLTDGAPELVGKVVEELVTLLQAQQINPVPYRPQMIGLVERFHRTWKDCVATYMSDEKQRDWDTWVDYALYAYNSGRHSTVLLSPNELMMGRRLRSPNELLRAVRVTEAGGLVRHHEKLLVMLKESNECAEVAREREQRRQARYYNRRTRKKREFQAGDRVWMFRPPRGPKASKFVYQWVGPLRIVESAGYENFLLEREDDGGEREQFIAHVSFLVTYRYPATLLDKAASDFIEQLDHEDAVEDEDDEPAPRAAVRAATAPSDAASSRRGKKRTTAAVGGAAATTADEEVLVELRRRRRRNKAGQYVLEYNVRSLADYRRWRSREEAANGGGDNGGRWLSISEYDELFNRGKVVEDLTVDEGV